MANDDLFEIYGYIAFRFFMNMIFILF
jgi:hypothetical protein